MCTSTDFCVLERRPMKTSDQTLLSISIDVGSSVGQTRCRFHTRAVASFLAAAVIPYLCVADATADVGAKPAAPVAVDSGKLGTGPSVVTGSITIEPRLSYRLRDDKSGAEVDLVIKNIGTAAAEALDLELLDLDDKRALASKLNPDEQLSLTFNVPLKRLAPQGGEAGAGRYFLRYRFSYNSPEGIRSSAVFVSDIKVDASLPRPIEIVFDAAGKNSTEALIDGPRTTVVKARIVNMLNAPVQVDRMQLLLPKEFKGGISGATAPFELGANQSKEVLASVEPEAQRTEGSYTLLVIAEGKVLGDGPGKDQRIAAFGEVRAIIRRTEASVKGLLYGLLLLGGVSAWINMHRA